MTLLEDVKLTAWIVLLFLSQLYEVVFEMTIFNLPWAHEPHLANMAIMCGEIPEEWREHWNASKILAPVCEFPVLRWPGSYRAMRSQPRLSIVYCSGLYRDSRQ